MNKYAYGIDVGGTSIKVGLFDYKTNDMIEHYEIETPKYVDGSKILKAIYDTILECNQRNHISIKDVLGVGIDIPCPVKDGYVKSCANLHINDMDLQLETKKYFDDHIAVTIANDATIAAYGENASLEHPYNNAVLITLGTGVGGGIIIDGNIVEGSTGFGGEIGHIKVYEEEDKVCGCGFKGCLEQICGTQGILDYTKHLLEANKSILSNTNLTVKSIFDAAKQGDQVALKTVHRVAKYIGIASSILSMIVEPEIFIIGGGVSRAGDFLLDMIRKYYAEHARFSTGNIPFKLAETGNNAGMIGSVLLLKNTLEKGSKHA